MRVLIEAVSRMEYNKMSQAYEEEFSYCELVLESGPYQSRVKFWDTLSEVPSPEDLMTLLGSRDYVKRMVATCEDEVNVPLWYAMIDDEDCIEIDGVELEFH